MSIKVEPDADTFYYNYTLDPGYVLSQELARMSAPMQIEGGQDSNYGAPPAPIPSADSSFIDLGWQPTYDHPLLHLARAPATADHYERRGYNMGFFINPVFRNPISEYTYFFVIRNAPDMVIFEGGIVRVWSWMEKAEGTMFVRRMVGHDALFAAFEVGFLDEMGKVGIMVCDLSATVKTDEMNRRIWEGTAVIPEEVWHLSISCDRFRLTWVRAMSMEDVNSDRRDVARDRRYWTVDLGAF